MIRRPPRATRPATLFPYTTLFRSLAPQEGLARVRLFASDLHPPVARLEPGKGGHFVCATCAASRRRGANRGEIQCTRECTRPIHVTDSIGYTIELQEKNACYRSSDGSTEESRVGKECVGTCR